MNNINSFKIYFHNLNEETQKEYLKFLNVESLEEANLDNFYPIAIIDIEEDCEEESMKSNKEIIEFSNAWLGMSERWSWKDNEKKFNKIVNTLPIGLNVVGVDNNFEAKIIMINEIPFISNNIEIVAVTSISNHIK